MQDRQWALVKWSSLAVSVGSITVAGGLLWFNSKTIVSEETEQPVGEHVQQPQAKVEKPLMVERKGDRIIWRLQADVAKQQEQGMHLTEPRLEMFTETGEVIPIQGREAWFEPMRKNIHFKGAVQVSYRDWTLNSETLRYDSGRDEVLIPGTFEAKKPDMTLRGKGLRVDRKTERLTVDHDVWVEDATGRQFGGQK